MEDLGFKDMPFERELQFHGKGSKLFGIFIVNFLLIIITLGLYYPWAKAALLRYYYQETEFAGSRFTFHGTGKEMFIGFIKVVGMMIAVMVFVGLLAATEIPALAIAGVLFMYAFFIGIIPFAMHGFLRYRTSRTSWRGIHGGYRGDLRTLVGIYFKGLLLTIVTFGIYGPWFAVTLRSYVMKHLRLGNVEFEFTGKGDKLFGIHIKGIVLSMLTLGIYLFWYSKEVFDYYVNNTYIHQGQTVSQMKSSISVSDIFSNFLLNIIAIPCTLGLAIPWVVIRNIQLVMNHLHVEGEFDPSKIIQTEEAYHDATGEGLFDVLEMDM